MILVLDWQNEWSLNIDALDREHRDLIGKLADICSRFGPEASAERTSDARALAEALADLGEAVREHFDREEDLMQAVGYAGIAEHLTEHALLMAEYADMVRHWGAEDVQVLDEVAQASVRDWILDHILGADRDFAKAFLESDDQFELTRHHRDLAALATLSPGSGR
jgi:hemerythrin-like metal-binding protein